MSYINQRKGTPYSLFSNGIGMELRPDEKHATTNTIQRNHSSLLTLAQKPPHNASKSRLQTGNTTSLSHPYDKHHQFQIRTEGVLVLVLYVILNQITLSYLTFFLRLQTQHASGNILKYVCPALTLSSSDSPINSSETTGSWDTNSNMMAGSEAMNYTRTWLHIH